MQNNFHLACNSNTRHSKYKTYRDRSRTYSVKSVSTMSENESESGGNRLDPLELRKFRQSPLCSAAGEERPDRRHHVPAHR